MTETTGVQTRTRGSAVRRARKAVAKPDGMATARAAQAALDERMAAEAATTPDTTVTAGRGRLAYTKVAAKKAPPKKAAPPVVLVEIEPEAPVPVRQLDGKVRLRAPATAATATARAFWTLDDARQQIRDGYSLERVVVRTGYSEVEIGKVVFA